MASCRDSYGTRPAGSSHGDVEWRVAHDHDVGRIESCAVDLGDPIEGDGKQVVAFNDFAAEGAGGKVLPEVEVLQLEASACFEVTGEQAKHDVPPFGEVVQQRADTGHDAFARAGVLELALEVAEIGFVKPAERVWVAGQLMSRRELSDDPGVCSAVEGKRGRTRPFLLGKHLFRGVRHRPAAGPAGQHEGAIDVEEEKPVQLSPRTFAARGPFADGSSSKLTR